jgi:hypothetical protein
VVEGFAKPSGARAWKKRKSVRPEAVVVAGSIVPQSLSEQLPAVTLPGALLRTRQLQVSGFFGSFVQ